MQQLSVKLALREALCGLDDGATGIIAAVDTAEALLGLANFRGASARLIGLSWDAESLRVDIGAETALDATGAYVGAFRLAREMTLIAAAAAGVAAIDTAFRCGARSRRLDGRSARCEAGWIRRKTRDQPGSGGDRQPGVRRRRRIRSLTRRRRTNR